MTIIAESAEGRLQRAADRVLLECEGEHSRRRMPVDAAEKQADAEDMGVYDPNMRHAANRYPRLTYSLLSLATHQVGKLLGYSRQPDPSQHLHTFAKREQNHGAEFIVFVCLIPILVLLSGLFAGLTLGYMSLDETQLHVLSISGTPKQKKYAKKILPIRKNGHLLLITLLLANMIANEALPVISEPVFGNGIVSVVSSTALIVM
ncbi:hypothetical protein NUW54_g10514 [Trametes sanguinea]|uniref:Uncharacterized protein n=1 Tax=Trametes sanguinea TaxID=158606 RepID=A0ACC1NYM7_9APHY|nr:hypothetical protein NUW54_g10514 [Trametes sanguinea]